MQGDTEISLVQLVFRLKAAQTDLRNLSSSPRKDVHVL